ncbi:D-xylose transport system permease protein [Kribbella orskensis]|uniref:Xylose transport system permease protein XylH n=1 Tax=Kribbella orskensis TaxID=2512216 RepID=A0ABY2BTM7_9ACTN|nr:MULTISPECIES: ABC transporter permease [Kribbella]TCN44777.1 D-xylose transport system permease protein [Kribbella sp. VKM Ac-2500]TCO31445.1 D-xylose transport system permease protein [Kribbella orskensis]
MSAQTDDLVKQDQRGPDAPSEGLGALGAYIKDYFGRVRGGELGSIPALVGLIVITAVFSLVHQGFLSAYNLEALVIQAAPIIVMAMGLVFVLLLGEIDLSAGTTGGLCSAITAVLILRHGASWWLGLIVGLVVGLLIGFGMGWLRARIGIPSFVITLATFLAFQGVTLILIGGQGSVILPDNSPLIKLENSFVPLWLGWVLLALVVVGYAAIKINDALGRRRSGLSRPPFTVIAAKVAVLAVLGAVFTYEMGVNRNLSTNAFFNNKAQGMPWVVVLLVILFAVWNFVLTRTRYGRHVYAVGGNDEASRRAGIVVSRIRISVFVICSGMAAVSGIIAASLLQSVQSNAGAGNTLLLAVGAAVIGGTSLFGGHGRIIDAVLGGLVVAVIINGMSDLIQGANSAGYEWVVTGAVLLLAAGFDAVVRRSRAT